MSDPTPNTHFVGYDPATGEITSTGTLPTTDFPLLAKLGSYLAGNGDPATQYVDIATKKLVAKAANPAVLTGTTFTSLPTPCTLVVCLRPDPATPDIYTQTNYTVTDGTAEMSFGHAGTFWITVKSPKFKDAEFIVKVSA